MNLDTSDRKQYPISVVLNVVSVAALERLMNNFWRPT